MTKQIKNRSILVTYDDVSTAVKCALLAAPKGFHLFNLVSAQADERFLRRDIVASEISFIPRSRIGEDGKVARDS
jgi:hypothetical protein